MPLGQGFGGVARASTRLPSTRLTVTSAVCVLALLDSLGHANYTHKVLLGSLAQLAEQLTFNQRVIGSSPIRPTSSAPSTSG